MFNLVHLDTFLKVAELGSLNRAADAMFISTHAVINQINNLESELNNVKLFERNNRGISLTVAGEALYKEARDILSYCEESRKRVIAIGRAYNNNIRIAIPTYLMSDYLKALIERFHEYCPEYYLELVPCANNMQERLKMWSNFDDWTDVAFDLYTDSDFGYGTYSGFKGVEIYKRPLVCNCSIKNPLANLETIKISDLDSYEIHMLVDSIDASLAEIKRNIKTILPDAIIVEHYYFDAELYNNIANGKAVMIDTIGNKENHPLIKAVTIEYEKLSYGFICKEQTHAKVNTFLRTIKDVRDELSWEGKETKNE